MTALLTLPWAELCVALPLLGAAGVGAIRDAVAAGRFALAVGFATLLAALLPWVARESGGAPGAYFAVDALTAPPLPLVALLHLATVLATARVKVNRTSLAGHLAAGGLQLGALAAAPGEPGLLVAFLALDTLPAGVELRRLGKPTRLYALHMAVYVVLLVAGTAAVGVGETGPGALLTALAVLVRAGAVPAHLWVADLFEHATFGTALLFAALLCRGPLRPALARGPPRAVRPVAGARDRVFGLRAGLRRLRRHRRVRGGRVAPGGGDRFEPVRRPGA